MMIQVTLRIYTHHESMHMYLYTTFKFSQLIFSLNFHFGGQQHKKEYVERSLYLACFGAIKFIFYAKHSSFMVFLKFATAVKNSTREFSYRKCLVSVIMKLNRKGFSRAKLRSKSSSNLIF